MSLFAILTIGFTIFFAFVNVLNGDEREHLTASFYIYKGYVPYRDFFEHHHPLLWYIFSPFLIFFNNSEYIWYVIRIFSLILIIINSIYINKICHLILPNKYFSILSICLSLVPHCVFLSQTEFRPDSLMITFFIIGIYYYFNAIKKHSQTDLSISFIFFTLSLLTLQKAVFHLVPYFFTTLYLIYKHTFSIKDFFKSTIIPFIICLLYATYLYKTNSLKDYYELNWLLNLKINFGIQYPVHQTYYYIIANILALFLIFSKKTFLRYICFYGILTSFILQFIFLGAFRHYWLPIYPYFAIIYAYSITMLTPKLRTITLLVIFCTTLNNNILWYKKIKNYGSLSTFIYLSKQVLSLTNKDDFIIGCNSTVGGLRLDATGYYWFGRDYIAILDHYYFKRHEFPNSFNILKSRKPKLISSENWRKCITPEKNFTFDCKSIPTYDKDFLEKHYSNQGFIYTRKY